MDKDIITKISSLEMRLENSLEAEDFVSVSKLSIDLDQLIKELTGAIKVKKLTKIVSNLTRKEDFFLKTALNDIGKLTNKI